MEVEIVLARVEEFCGKGRGSLDSSGGIGRASLSSKGRGRLRRQK